MPGNDDFLPENVDLAGEIETLSKSSGEHILDRMTRNIVRGMISSSAWDEPLCTAGCDCQPFIENVNATSAEHRQLARVVAAESAVLLKNEGQVLPIDRATKTIGYFASPSSLTWVPRLPVNHICRQCSAREHDSSPLQLTPLRRLAKVGGLVVLRGTKDWGK